MPVSVRLRPGEDDWSGNLADGVAAVKVPDPDWDSVGGIVPDLILYKEDGACPINPLSGGLVKQ